MKRNDPPGFVQQLFKAVDQMDEHGFAGCFVDQGIFRYANYDEVCGCEKIAQVAKTVFSQLRSLRHEVESVWEEENILLVEGKARYVLENGKEFLLPFFSVLRMVKDQGEEKLQNYRVFMDPSPLFN